MCFFNVECYFDFVKYFFGGLVWNCCDEVIVDEIEGLGFVFWFMVLFLYMVGFERFEDFEKIKYVFLFELLLDWLLDVEEEVLVVDVELEDDYESDGINDEEISEDDFFLEDELILRVIFLGSDEEVFIFIDFLLDDEVLVVNFFSMELFEDEVEVVVMIIIVVMKRKWWVVLDFDDDEDEVGNNLEECSVLG